MRGRKDGRRRRRRAREDCNGHTRRALAALVSVVVLVCSVALALALTGASRDALLDHAIDCEAGQAERLRFSGPCSGSDLPQQMVAMCARTRAQANAYSKWPCAVSAFVKGLPPVAWAANTVTYLYSNWVLATIASVVVVALLCVVVALVYALRIAVGAALSLLFRAAGISEARGGGDRDGVVVYELALGGGGDGDDGRLDLRRSRRGRFELGQRSPSSRLLRYGPD